MKIKICAIALVAAVSACVSSEGVTPDASPAFASAPGATEGQVSIHGIASSRVLGAVDTQTLVDNPTIANGGEVAGSTSPASSTASPGIGVEGAQASAVLAAIDPTKLVGDGAAPKATAAVTAEATTSGRAAEVQAVVDSGKRYTTKDLAAAQLEALRAD